MADHNESPGELVPPQTSGVLAPAEQARLQTMLDEHAAALRVTVRAAVAEGIAEGLRGAMPKLLAQLVEHQQHAASPEGLMTQDGRSWRPPAGVIRYDREISMHEAAGEAPPGP